MKKFNQNTRRFIETSTALGVKDKDRVVITRYSDSVDAIISSEEFINTFKGYIDDIALRKSVDGRKYARSTEYAAIGVLDRNDLMQEAYLAFLEAYAKYKESKENFNHGGEIWNYLKKTTILNFERSIRGLKDGVRIPERFYFENENLNSITALFSQIETVFSNNVEEVSLTEWETDLVGAFMDVHMDDYLDLTRMGNRDLKKNERAILKALYGLDQPRMTYAELEDYYKVSQSTIRKVKQRAIERLQTEESKEEIAVFLHEYCINTQADTEKYRK